MKKNILIFLLSLSVLAISCKKDNKEPPTSTISGRVVYNKQPLSLRSNGVQLELWQRGYQLFSKIPVYVNQDGTFSAKVFDGNYKLTLLKGNGPWADKTDSIDVSVKGSVNLDVSVDPYFIINNATFQKNGNAVSSTVSLQRVNTSRNLEAVRIYVGQTTLVDQVINAGMSERAASAITDITAPITLSVNIPASLAGKDYVFARVGVKIAGVQELVYSLPQLVALK